jgi:beta-lactamase regulating signal transducer with metallopeptidase domain
MSPLDLLVFKLAETSLRASLVIAPLLLLRPWLRRAVGSQWLCLLSLVVLGRLLFALPVESRWSLANYWSRQSSPAVADQAKVRVSISSGKNEVSAPVVDDVTAPRIQRKASAAGLMGALWAMGVAAGLAGLGLRLWKTHRLAALTSPITDVRVLEIYESIPAGIRRGVQLRMTTALNVPTLAGVLRPQIWLPASWGSKLTRDELRQVLLHELGHACRRDLLVQWLFAIAQCLHWFNPLVWALARCARLDREMACDAWVLTQGDIGDPAQYGATLLKMVQMLSNPLRTVPCGVAMATSKQNLTARIAGIGGFCQRPSWRGIVGVGIVLAGLAALTTSGAAIGESAPPVNSPAPVDVPASPASDAKADGPQIEIEAKFVELSEAAYAELTIPGAVFAEAPGAKPNEEKQAAGEVTAILEAPKLEALVRALNQKKGVDLVSSPRVTTKPGQKARVEIVRVFNYPTKFVANKEVPPTFTPKAFGEKNLGVTLDVVSTIEADGKTIRLHAIPQVVDFLGFKSIDDKEPAQEESGPNEAATQNFDPHKPWKPVFSEHKLDSQVRLLSGQTAALRLGVKTLLQQDQPPKTLVLIAFVTAKIVTGGLAQAQASQPEQVSALGPKANTIPNTEAIQNKLAHIIIPKIEFRDATVLDAVDALRKKSIEFDTMEIDPKQKGVNIVLKVDSAPGLNAAPTISLNDVRITLSLTDVSVGEALKYIADLARRKVKIEPYAAAVVPLSENTNVLITKEYAVHREMFENTGGKSAKQVLEAAGVQFPPGSSAKFLSAAQKLIVRNTKGNLDVVDSMVAVVDSMVAAQQAKVPPTLLTGSKAADAAATWELDGQRVRLALLTGSEDAAETVKAKAASDGVPLAIIKPGDKEGFVHSPFALDAGLIDVRGFPPGTEVKCPYTGKHFRIPPL